MSKKGTYSIGFSGLKEGLHEYSFELEKAFFEQFEDLGFTTGTGTVEVQLEKRTNLLVLHLDYKGLVNATCDRCNDALDLPFIGNDELYVKFGSGDLNDENVVVLHENAHEMILDEILYELIATHIPFYKSHQEDLDEKCNEEVLQFLNNEEETKVDPRWAELNKLMTEN